MAYVPAPTTRTAVFQGEIEVDFPAPISAATRPYPIDFEQGQSGYSMIFDTEFRRAIYGAGGALPPTGISVSVYANDIETHFENIPPGDATIDTLPQRVGFWDSYFYMLASQNIANEIVEYYAYLNTVDVEAGGTVAPTFTLINDTLTYGASSDVVSVLYGASRVDGGLPDFPRLANISYVPWIDGANRRTDFYSVAITNLGFDRANAFSLVNDTNSFSSEENSPITTTDSGFNWSYHPDSNEGLHLLIRWNEQPYDFKGTFTQAVFALELSVPADDAIFQTMFSSYDFYFNPCKEGFIFSFSDWSTGEYYFYKVSPDGLSYWRVIVNNLPMGYDGTPALMQDDLGNWAMADDYANLFYAASSPPPAAVTIPPRIYPAFKVGNPVFLPFFDEGK